MRHDPLAELNFAPDLVDMRRKVQPQCAQWYTIRER